MRVLTRHISLLTLAVVLAAAVPLFGQGAVLRKPDQHAIPMLISRTRNMLEYGTGVVVGASTILTADHVATTNKIEVHFPTATLTGQAVCRAYDEDLAVIRVTLPKGTPLYHLSSRPPVVGEIVTVGGYPSRKWMVTKGRITHIISHATLGGRVVNSPMIVFEPALHQGASGSPVLDSRGQVIAIFVASNTPANYSIAFPNGPALRTCRKFVQ